MNKGKLIVLSGFSGSGKGTVVNGILEKYDTYTISISATTRSPRDYETDGVHYYFKTREEFDKMIEEDAFIEYATFVNNSYGTPKSFVEEKLAEGINVILEIEVQGALKVKEKFPEAVMIFIIPPSALELKNRLVGRQTETMEVINNRLKRASEEVSFVKSYDYVIINDDLGKCIDDINNVVMGNTAQASFVSKDFCDKFKEELEEVLKGE